MVDCQSNLSELPRGISDLPQMAIDPVSGHLFVVYTSGAHGGIWLLVSTDASESWSTPTQVATFTPLNTRPGFRGRKLSCGSGRT